ncbi:MAG TPA: cytochrome c [Pyrinomonadaceae bacterium]|nr:cytochrome c [Pyrinomonadaceae bacterium]
MSNTKNSGRRAAGGRQLPRGLRTALYCLLTAAFCLLSTGCRMDMQDQPRYEAYEPGDPKFFRDGAASRPLAENTVPRGFLRDDVLLYTGRAEGQPGAGPMSGGSTGGVGTATPNTASTTAGTMTQVSGDPNVRGNVAGGIPGANAGTGGPDIFPASVPIDEATLARGRDRFNAYCSMCHGAAGDSDGMIVRRGFQRPPSFHEDRLQEPASSAAHFFDVITNGWGAMPSYAEMIPPRDRWAIIAYVRALQLSRKMSANELSPEERGRVETDARQAGPPQSGTQTQGEPQRGGVRH